MSILIQSFDPTDSTKLDVRGVGKITTNGHNQQEQLVLYNSSLVCFQVTFLDKTTDIMPPSWAKSFTKSGPIGDIQYQPIFTLPAQAGAQPISTCYGVIYEVSEHIADLNVPLQYVYNVGNPGGIAVSGSTLTNSGNPPGTQVIKLSSTANGSDTLDISNDGIWNAMVTVAGVLHQIFTTQAAVPYVQLGQAGDLMRALGDFAVNGKLFGNGGLLVFGETMNQFINGMEVNNNQFLSWLDSGGTRRGAIKVDNSNNTQLADAGGGRIYFTNNAGGQYFLLTDNANGVQVGRGSPGDAIDQTNGAIYLKAVNGGMIFQDRGSSQGWSIHSANGGVVACGGGTTISHGLGVTPDLIVGTPNMAQTGSATVGLDSQNSSTFQATVGAGTQINFWALKR